MSNPRNQHQASQAYLRNFANAKDQVSLYDRIAKKTVCLVGIRNVAAKRDFYTVKDDIGNDDFTFETEVLARVDGDHRKLMPKLLEPAPSLTTSERKKFDDIITLQFLRTREGRRFLEDNADFNLRFLLDAQFSGIPEEKHDTFMEVQYANATADEKVLVKNMVQSPDQHLEFTTLEWLGAIARNLPAISEDLAQRYWLILDSDREAFLTSDTPVVLIGRDTWSLPTAEFIAWPVSPKRIILRPMHREWDGQKVVLEKASPDRVRELNQELANRARQQIIWHPDTDPISSITLPEGELLVRVGGRHAGPDERPFDVWREERIRVQETMAPFIKRRKLLDEAIEVGLEQLRRGKR